MKGFLHKLFQVAAVSIQFGNVLLPVLDDHNKIILGAGLGVLQSLAGLQALRINPDGTPATEPYVKVKTSK